MVNDPLSNYTREELKSLQKFLKQETKSIGYYLKEPTNEQWSAIEFCKALKDCCYRSHQVYAYTYKVIPDLRVFLEPLDEMPLLINDDEYLTQLVAKWRLENGK